MTDTLERPAVIRHVQRRTVGAICGWGAHAAKVVRTSQERITDTKLFTSATRFYKAMKREENGCGLAGPTHNGFRNL